MQQVVDLQNDANFQSLNVAVLSITADSIDELSSESQKLGIVLVNQDGTIAWIQDYGAPDNPNRTMYVPIDEIIQAIETHLKS